jgi:hypothetical protein
MLAGALEHQMLEEMREPGFAWRLVGRADLVPDHLGDDGCAVIGDHHHLQAVLKRERGGTFRRDRGLGQGVTGGKGGGRNQYGEERNGEAAFGHHDLCGASFANAANGFARTIRKMRAVRAEPKGSGKPRQRTRRQRRYTVTKARDELNYSPYLPWDGLYSLFSDSFGPVP